ncbi:MULTISPECIES: hypothetical protein [Prauserella salsuginis group]|uniref:Uncharacterized protein n=1 Tax=Prauserella salsuginis TaxID=387889 RepID=A0ABW6G7I8_9PSEU|nr:MULTISPECIES: hypothetical protein [Prauserella salsuginis group]
MTLAAGELVAVHHGNTPGADAARAALESLLSGHGVHVEEVTAQHTEAARHTETSRHGTTSPHRRNTRLVVATHHSATPAAQRYAHSRDAPILLPGFLAAPADGVNSCLRPSPVVMIQGADATTRTVRAPVFDVAHLPGPLRCHAPSGAEHDCAQLFVRPCPGGVLTGTDDGHDDTVAAITAAQSVHLETATTAAVDDRRISLPPGRYRIAPADRPLYQVHTDAAREQASPGATRRPS